MAEVRPFKALRPRPELAEKIAALPYDVMNASEARQVIGQNPLSFLRVTKSEALFPDGINQYTPEVYLRAKAELEDYRKKEQLIQDSEDCFYIYRQQMGAHVQIGLVAVSSVEEYRRGVIKKHELTRPDKEDDRVNHIKYLAAQTGAVFLAYKKSASLARLMQGFIAQNQPEYNFTAEDGIKHTLYVVKDPANIQKIQAAFTEIDYLYIADGHHRSAAALRVADLAKANNPGHTGQEDYNYFLTVIFPDDMMQILDYNRTVLDLNGYSKAGFLQKIQEKFILTELNALAKPSCLHEFTMYLAGKWYKLAAKEGTFASSPIESLDVSILQNNLLQPVLGIADPRTDKRIQFIGGIRGLGELQKAVDSQQAAVAFALYPTSMHELMAIADAGEIMPPKSTWFEPKLRDAMAVHLIEEKFLK